MFEVYNVIGWMLFSWRGVHNSEICRWKRVQNSIDSIQFHKKKRHLCLCYFKVLTKSKGAWNK